MSTPTKKDADSVDQSTIQQLLDRIASLEAKMATSAEPQTSAYAKQRRSLEEEVASRVESLREAANHGRYQYIVAVKGFKRSIAFRCDVDDIKLATAIFTERFGARYDSKKMTITKPKQPSPQAA